MHKVPRLKPWLVRRWWFILLILAALACLAYFSHLYPDWLFNGLD